MQILAVVVLYKTSFDASQTLTTLSRALGDDPTLLDTFEILLWDNSPEPLDAPTLPFPFRYHHATGNVGLSGAFNIAAEEATRSKTPWLLLLDQDTSLPGGFLPRMLAHAQALLERGEIAAIVPTVYVKDFTVSPRRMLLNRHAAYPAHEPGVLDGEAAAINSATLLRVSSLLQVGGYSDAFWLDYSDWYVFHQFYLHRLQVWHAADIELQHSMTVMDYDNLMTPWRYRNFIAAEGAFNDLYKSSFENSVQTLRLFVRTFKQRLRFKDAEFSRITWRYFLLRLFASRKARIARWQSVTAERQGKSA